MCYFYYFIPMYVAAICSLIYPGQKWIKDWSLIHAGASIQAQLVFIWSSLKWRTQEEFRVPDTVLARSIFWPVNLSLVIVPHLHAMYCHRNEMYEFLTSQFRPSLKSEQVESKTPEQSRRMVTRQQKKNQ